MMIKDGSVFDEFCSFLDEYTARTLSYSLGRYVRRMGLKRVVVATCREEIIEWLNPDWVFNCDTNEMSYDRRAQRRPSIDLEIHPCSVEVWRYFKDYHYLTGDINKGARCWVAFWGDKMVGFSSSIAMPSGSLKNAWRETRLVVLPEFQGVGIGNALSEYVARIHIDNGCRYFSKTASLMLGEHREKSKMWKSTSKNRMKRKDYIGSGDKKFSKELREKHAGRLTYSHEFIG